MAVLHRLRGSHVATPAGSLYYIHSTDSIILANTTAIMFIYIVSNPLQILGKRHELSYLRISKLYVTM